MATPGRRPGTEVEQEFVTPAPILEDPPQPAVIIGIAKQLESDLSAGTYDARSGAANDAAGADFTANYPDLTLNATVDEDTVTVKLQNTYGTFDVDQAFINNPTSPSATEFEIDKDYEIERVLVSGGSTGSFSGTATFTDLNQRFISAGVAPASGDVVSVELRITSGSLSGNNYDITSVTSQTVLVTSYAGPALFEDNIGYDIVETRKAFGTVLVSYEAVRSDLNDTLVFITDDDSIEDLVGKIDPRNPAGFAVDKARLNAGESQIYFTGISADTVAEHTRALEFMEVEPGYGLVPLTQDTAVHQLYEAHVDTTSLPENKLERVVYLNRALLLRETKIATSDARTGSFVNGTGIFTDTAGGGFDFNDYVVTGDFIIYDDGGTIRELLIQQILSATTVLINVAGSVNHPGANLPAAAYTALSATKSKTEQAQFLGAYAQSFANRRVVHVWPDEVEVSFDGALQLVPGYFLAAAVAGLKSGQLPQQPLTNLSIAGFTGLRHSNRYFNESQLKILSANGVFVVEQAVETAAPYIRQQRTTDVSEIKKTELSVTTTIDFVAQLFRQELDPYIGRYNITPELLDTLKIVVDGLFRRLTGTTSSGPTVLSARLISIEQDPVEIDTINIVIEVEAPIPANFIKVRIQV